MASPDYVNYSIRPNKNVERKLLIEALRQLQPRFDLKAYQYVGFGSYWFVDFRLVHTLLGIDDMYSIERHEPSRAHFNKPYRHVTVEEGDSSTVLPTLPLRERLSLLWLDYDTTLQGPALADIPLVVGRIPTRSIVIVTVNADKRQLRGRKDADENPLTEEQALETDAGKFLPRPLPKDGLSLSGFPATVGAILHAAARHGLAAAGRSEDFQPLFGFKYSDGSSTMATIAGMVVDDDARNDLEVSGIYALDFAQRDVAPLTVIDVPPLTPKEKATIDQLLPTVPALTTEELQSHGGFKLKPSQLESYARYYKHYPLYGEVVSL